jgi:hypothetical protein
MVLDRRAHHLLGDLHVERCGMSWG